MSDVTDRLAALDPAGPDPYHPRNLDQMISRIVASSPSGAAHSTWWQRVQVRVAATLILGTAIGAGTLALVEGGPTLASLAIQTTIAPHPGTFGATNAVQSLERTYFIAATSLASSSSSSPSRSLSFQLHIPKDSARVALRLASAFHVVGTLHHRGSDWTVRSAAGASLDYQTSGAAPQWYYSSTTPPIAPATASSSTDVVLPSHATLITDARAYLTLLGLHYSVSSPVYTESTVSTRARAAQAEEEVSYTVNVRGVPTDQTVSFSVNAHNALLYAQGPAFEVGPGTDYPLQSPLEGVSTLNSIEHTASSGPKVGASASEPATLRARLTSATISLATFQLTNGARWLLPLYTYSGRVAQSGGAPTNRTWSEIAIVPSYTRLSLSEARSVLNH